MHGYEQADVAGQHYTAFYPTDSPEQEQAVAELIRQARQHGVGRAETWRQRRDTTVFPAAVTLSLLRDDTAQLVGRVLSVRDVTDRRAAEDQLREQALYDVLTGLPNRQLLLDQLARHLTGIPPRPNAVLFVDLDKFK